MGISRKMVESEEWKNSMAAMKYMFALLRQQLEITSELMEAHRQLERRGYEQYRTYCHNKRRDKITNVPSHRIHASDLRMLMLKIERFFAWEKEFKETGKCI